MPESDYARAPNAVDFNQQLAMMAAQAQSGSDMISRLLPIIMSMSPAMGGRQSPEAVAARIMMPMRVAGAMGAPTDPFIGAGISNIAGRGMMGLSAFGAFQDIQGAGGPALGGGGMGFGQVQNMTGFMGGLATGGTTQMDVAQITAGAGQGGFTRGITDVKQARQQLQTMVQTVVELSRELNMTIQEVSQGMNQVRGMGFARPSQAGQALRGMMGTAGITGMDLNTTMAVVQDMGRGYWQQAGAVGRPVGLAAGAETARQALNVVGGAARGGFISDEQLMNATGMGGQEGVAAFSGRLMNASINQMGKSSNKYMMAAFMNASTGEIDQGAVNQFMSGQLGLGRLQQMASQNISAIGGYGRWLDLQPQLQGQLQAATGGMSGLGFAAAGMQSMGMGMNDPGAATVFGRLTGLRNPMEARMGLGMMQNWGAISESNQMQARVGERQQELIRIQNERQQSSSLVGWVERATSDFNRKASSAVEQATNAVSGRLTSLLGGGAFGESATVGTDFGWDVARGAVGNMQGLGRPGAAAGGAFSDPFAEIERSRGAIRDLSNRARSVTGPERERLLGQLSTVQAQLAEGASEIFREGGGYWGGRSQDIGVSRQELETRTGLTGSSEVVKRYYDTRDARSMLNQQFAQSMAGPRGDAFLSRFREALGSGVASTTDQLKDMISTRGLTDILAGVSKERLGGVLDVLQQFTPGMARLTQEQRTAGIESLSAGLEAYTKIKEAAKAAGPGAELTQGTADVLSGVSLPGERAAIAQRQAQSQAAAIWGGEGAGVVAGVQGAGLSQSTRLLNWLQSEPGKQVTGAKSFSAWMERAGIDAETQKSLFGEGALGATSTRENLVSFLQNSLKASGEAYSQTLRDQGVLSTGATTEMQKYLGREGTDFQRQVAAGFIAARERLDAGDLPGALARAERNVLDITAPTVTTSRFRELSKFIPPETMQRYEGLRAARSRRGEGGETITQGELTNMGADLSDILGEDMAKAVSGSSRLMRSAPIQQKIQSYLANAALTPGRATGQQGEDVSAATTNPQEQMATAFSQGFSRAFPNGISLAPNTTPILVKVAEGINVTVEQRQ